MKKIFYLLACVLFIGASSMLLQNCQSEKVAVGSYENEKENVSFELRSIGALLGVSYEITIYKRYHYDFEKLTELDLAHLNPSEERQRIQMFLMPDGTVNMAIEELDSERFIKHQERITPSVRRTEIVGNTAFFYDDNQRMVSSHPIEMPKRIELAEQIKHSRGLFSYEEAVRNFKAMQGGFSDLCIERMVAEAQSRGRFTEHADGLITVRENLSEVIPGQRGSRVTLVDRNINKVVAVVTYDEKENMTSRTFFGYDREETPVINAIRTEILLEMPSGAKVLQVISSRIENINFTL